MRRGTTITNTFSTDTDLTTAEVVYITYKQNGRTVLEKSIEDLTITAEEITVELSQTDTLALMVGVPVQIQIRARWASGSAIASNIMTGDVERILKEGVI